MSIVGPSGSGKSTLLRIIAGLDQQTSGNVLIGDVIVDGVRAAHRNVAMVFQSYALYPHLTVHENIALPLKMTRLRRHERVSLLACFNKNVASKRATIDTEVHETAALLGISSLLSRKPGQLSGGQRQRVALGRAIVRHPSVFLMDEPLSNLDASLRVQMRSELSALHRRLGTTFVYVTHDQAEALTMSDRVAVMESGELLQVASPREIYESPANIRVARFIGSPRINILAGIAANAMVSAGHASFRLDLPVAEGTQVQIGLRPEAFVIANAEGWNRLTGRVVYIERLGSDAFVHLDADGPEPIVARVAAKDVNNIIAGRNLSLAVDPSDVLVFDAAGKRLQHGSAHASGPVDIPVRTAVA